MAKKDVQEVAKACAISRKDFKAKAKPMALKMGETLQAADAREFSTGSFGWGFSGKIVVEIDGVPVKCQVSCSIVVVGSKEAE